MNLNKACRILSLEKLESRRVLSADIVLAEPELYPAGGSPSGAIAGDVNLDGVLDLVVPNYGCCGRPTLLLGKGDGTFMRPTALRSAGGLADFDNDGFLDIVHATGLNQGVRVSLNGGITEDRWLGFSQPEEFHIAGSLVPQGRLAIGDFDGDRDLDVAVGDHQMVPPRDGVVWVLLNEGVSDGQWGGFGDSAKYDAGNFPDQVVAGDVDSDGDLDLVVGNYWGGDVSVVLGNGDGTFEPLGNYPVGNRTASIHIADLDGDGHLDVAASVFNTRDVAVLTGNGDGTFAEPVHYATHTSLWNIALGDLDGDQDKDIVATAFNGGEMVVLTNGGDGTFEKLAKEFDVTSGGTQTRPAVADFDGDGNRDVAVPSSFNGPGGVNIFLNVTGNDRDAVWDGSATIGNVGDGTSWNNANNWSIDGVMDSSPTSEFPGDQITFPASSTATTVHLGEDRTVHSITFESDFTLEGNTLHIATGGVTVAADVTATLNSSISDDTVLTKKGLGTLVVGGIPGDGIVQEGTLRGTGTMANVTVGVEGTLSPGVQAGTITINRNAVVEGTLLIEMDGSETDLLDVSRNVDLVSGNTLKLQALSSLGAPGEVTRTVLKGRRIKGTFTNEPAVGEHLGSGVFAVGAFGAASPVLYVRNEVWVSMFQAQVGDANGDRRFDQLDIVKVLQGGKYLTGETADWAEGDWDGDGLFDQNDIVVALQTDSYLKGA